MNKEITAIISKIKEKKELSGIADDLVVNSFNDYIGKNKINIRKITPLEIKLIVKDVRKELRNYVGRFQISLKKRKKLLQENRIDELLSTHFSTKERMQIYPQIKSIISKLRISSILDLGCGLNPIALADAKTRYYACDINKDDLSLVELFFKKNKISGKTFICDLRNFKHNFPKVDLCIIFKVLDILGKGSYETTEKIIKEVECKYFLISFSTKTLSGKPMRAPRRRWFENILLKLNYPFKIIETENEIFYLIDKSNSEDLEFARRTEEAWKEIETGKYTEMKVGDFIKEMKKRAI